MSIERYHVRNDNIKGKGNSTSRINVDGYEKGVRIYPTKIMQLAGEILCFFGFSKKVFINEEIVWVNVKSFNTCLNTLKDEENIAIKLVNSITIINEKEKEWIKNNISYGINCEKNLVMLSQLIKNKAIPFNSLIYFMINTGCLTFLMNVDSIKGKELKEDLFKYRNITLLEGMLFKNRKLIKLKTLKTKIQKTQDALITCKTEWNTNNDARKITLLGTFIRNPDISWEELVRFMKDVRIESIDLSKVKGHHLWKDLNERTKIENKEMCVIVEEMRQEGIEVTVPDPMFEINKAYKEKLQNLDKNKKGISIDIGDETEGEEDETEGKENEGRNYLDKEYT